MGARETHDPRLDLARLGGPPGTPERRAAGWWTAGVLYAALTVVYFSTAAPERLGAHTPFNHFALLADAWLHGRLDLGGQPPAYTQLNDFAAVQGAPDEPPRWYVSFPPFPAVLVAPLVWVSGGAARTKDGAFFVALAAVAPALLFLALERLAALGRSRRGLVENAGLALLFGLGTVYWFSAVQGTVWFAAHAVGAALAAGYLLASLGAARPALAGLLLGLGFATRTPLGFAFPLFLWEAARASLPEGAALDREGLRALDRRALALRLARFALPAAAVLAVLAWHNHARFGDALDFGHRHLQVVWQARIQKWGLFSYHYLARNLGVALTSLPWTPAKGEAAAAPFQITAHGLALWVTTPPFLWLALARGRKKELGLGALAATALAVALPSLLYQNTGWIQFGYRFSCDYAVFLVALLAVGLRRLGPAFWAAALVGCAVNAFGAVSFQRAGWDAYYVVDRRHHAIYQPD